MENFNAERVTNEIIDFIRDYYKKNNLKGAVLGISGGKDSGVVAGLFAKALGGENVLGLTLPCHSQSEDRTDAKLVAEKFGFELLNHDLTSVYDAFKEQLALNGEFDGTQTKDADINLKPRLRMATVYYYAALYSKLKKGTYIVAGTSNKCEMYVGYFTKGGDNTNDIAVLEDLTVDEVIEIGKYIGVPDKVLFKTPSDGLSNQSDEDKLGVKYKDIAAHMNGEEVDPEVEAKIEKLHNGCAHKFNHPSYKVR